MNPGARLKEVAIFLSLAMAKTLGVYMIVFTGKL
jgi:hypothetical protein